MVGHATPRATGGRSDWHAAANFQLSALTLPVSTLLFRSRISDLAFLISSGVSRRLSDDAVEDAKCEMRDARSKDESRDRDRKAERLKAGGSVTLDQDKSACGHPEPRTCEFEAPAAGILRTDTGLLALLPGLARLPARPASPACPVTDGGARICAEAR